MTELELIIDLFKDTDRQGPGSTENTARALGFVEADLSAPMQIADIGCGSGAQTLALAQHTGGHITAVDLFPEFLDRLNARATNTGLRHRITTLQASMENLPFQQEQFDIIWSEGAIYNMGFSEGIKAWKRFLKPGGYLAVSEITWTTHTRPAEIEQHWQREYPQTDTASAKIKLLEENGYMPVGYFTLPVNSWLQQYYLPLQALFPAFLARHGHSSQAVAVVEAQRSETELYQRHKSYYSYGFYVARKLQG